MATLEEQKKYLLENYVLVRSLVSEVYKDLKWILLLIKYDMVAHFKVYKSCIKQQFSL